MSNLELTLAKRADISEIKALMNRSIRELQAAYLTPDQVEASFAGMGLDTLLVEDGTYFAVREGGILVGCGGWSRRATLYGGNHTEGRDASLLNPETDPARIRAMYTHPEHTHKGIGRLIIDAAEAAAKAEGFKRLTMAATVAGIPFYRKCGYEITDEWEENHGAVPVPLATMEKDI